MPIAVIGDRDVGKSTFMVLTYSAQVKYTAQSGGDFRFYVDPATLGVISKEYNGMKMGKWPSETLLKNELEFMFGYGMKGGLMGKLFSKKKKFSSMKFRVYDLSQPLYNKMKTADKISSTDVVGEMDELRTSAVWVILLDPLAKDADGSMATFISNITLYARDTIHPIVILTKFDKVRKKKLAGPVPDVDDKERGDYARKIMKKRFPKTLSQIKNIQKLQEPKFFFSSVKCTKKKGKSVPDLKVGPDGFEIDFSYDEYVGFIKHIGVVGEQVGWDDKEK